MDPKSKAKVQNKRIAKEVKLLRNLPPEIIFGKIEKDYGTVIKLLRNLPPEIIFGKIEKDYGTVIRIEVQSSLIKSQYVTVDPIESSDCHLSKILSL